MSYPWSYNEKTKTVSIHYRFNDRLVGLPADTKIIIFEEIYYYLCSEFNQHISQDTLPNSLTHLTFGGDFNKPVNKDNLPASLTHLSFGEDFNQPIDTLPENLTHLKIKNLDYDKELNNLPYNLKILKIPSTYPIEKVKLPFGCEIITKYNNTQKIDFYIGKYI
jgi:hypothetical protein